tara:strand:+ start:154 stop:414 length:261 start_codon:yes stop_codon:yes gene_type:complete
MLAATLPARSSFFRAFFFCFRRPDASSDLRGRFAEAGVAAAEASPAASDATSPEASAALAPAQGAATAAESTAATSGARAFSCGER